MTTPLRPLSRSELRSLDAQAEALGLPTLCLMENAGRGAAEVLRRLCGGPCRVLVLCGPGNNGGDAAVLARHLDAWGFDLEILYLADPERLKGDALLHYQVLNQARLNPEALAASDDPPARLEAALSRADWVVEGLLGTGLTRAPEGRIAEAIETINDSGRPVLALDLPSGLDCDTGQPLGPTVHAAATATFAASKLGFHQAGASEFTGEVYLVEIGLPGLLLEPFRGGTTPA